jgi:demethylmenaquinone methyltransferase/2-methoxy-6-polyprenyl-1,4-benzoquinol methylase
VLERHDDHNSPVTAAGDERGALAARLFPPIAPTYDRYAFLLSFGQDARWRRALVAAIGAGPDDTVLDVACGTGAIAAELVRRYGCSVTGLDRSGEMLAEARRRLAAAGLGDRVRLERGLAEALPFPDASFDHLTGGYLLRYVADPAATIAELARVVRPGGRVALLDFGVPPNALVRAAWRLYVGIGLPTLGRLVSPGWHEVGVVLRRSIPEFYARFPLEEQLEAWRAAGLVDVRARRMSLGGGVVVRGTRG